MRVNTVQELEQYVLRKLGHPLINVEIDEDQLRDAVDDAIQYFMEESYEGSVEKVYLLDTSVKSLDYAMPENILAVTHMVRWGDESTSLGDSENLWSVSNILLVDGLLDPSLVAGSLGYMQSVNEYLANLKYMFTSNRQMFDFSPASRRIYFTEKPPEQVTVLRVIETIDGTDAPNLYNHRWIKAYSVALAKIQWGTHLSKFTVTMPGGTTVNAEAIKQDGEDKKKELEDELYDKYSAPADFIMM